MTAHKRVGIVAAGLAALAMGGCAARQPYETDREAPVVEFETQRGDTDVSLLDRELQRSTRSSAFYQIPQMRPMDFILNGGRDAGTNIQHVFDYSTIIAALNPGTDAKKRCYEELTPGMKRRGLDLDGDGLYAGRPAHLTGDTITFRGSFRPSMDGQPRVHRKSFEYGGKTYLVR